MDDELQAEVNRRRIEFLRTQLETCFTFARLAEAEQLHAERSLRDAETGYARIVRFVSDPNHANHITEEEGMELRAGIERLRATLGRLAGLRKCLALFAEVRSAVMESTAILEDARARTHLGDLPAAHVNEWYRSARHRWLDASTDLTNHLATHSINPTYFGQENGSRRGLTQAKPR